MSKRAEEIKINSKESNSSKSQKLCSCVDFHKLRRNNHTSFQPSRKRKPAESCVRCALKTSTQDHSQSIPTYPDPNCHHARSLSPQALFMFVHFELYIYIYLVSFLTRGALVMAALVHRFLNRHVLCDITHMLNQRKGYLTRFSEVSRRPQVVKSLTTMTAAQVH